MRSWVWWLVLPVAISQCLQDGVGGIGVSNVQIHPHTAGEAPTALAA